MKLLLSFCLIAAVLAQAGLCHAQAGKGEKLLFLGNSITLHGPAAKIGWSGNWGMAASALERDYVHLVVDRVAKHTGKKPEFKVMNVADFERKFEGFDVETKLKDQVAFGADSVIIAIGENVPALSTDAAKASFKESVVRMLTLLKRGGKSAIYVRSCFWANAAKDTALKEAAAQVGAVFIDIGSLSKDEVNYARSERKFEHDGVARHPGDRGMLAIADAIATAIEKAGK